MKNIFDDFGFISCHFFFSIYGTSSSFQHLLESKIRRAILQYIRKSDNKQYLM
jgi:hypothetical protein